MIARTVSTSWQTILADLSLILFMVTASALANAPDGPLGPDSDPHPAAAHPHGPPPAPAPKSVPIIAALSRAEPVGVWRSGVDAPPLAQWLREVARDPRLRLTITVHYAPGGRKAGLAQALHLDTAAGAHAADARILVEPGLPAGASAALGYDADGTQLASPGT